MLSRQLRARLLLVGKQNDRLKLNRLIFCLYD